MSPQIGMYNAGLIELGGPYWQKVQHGSEDETMKMKCEGRGLNPLRIATVTAVLSAALSLPASAQVTIQFAVPGIVVDVPRRAQMWCAEAFGPVAIVERAASVDEALALANDSPFGLQGALFTASLASAMRFSEEFDVGSLWVNEASRFRLDMYPFGGVKRSGFGREGVRYALEEMSQLKFTGIRFQ